MHTDCFYIQTLLFLTSLPPIYTPSPPQIFFSHSCLLCFVNLIHVTMDLVQTIEDWL